MMGVLFGAIVGALCAGFLFVTGFNLTWDLRSSDFLGAVLSALGALMGLVSVLLGIVALAIAVAAFFGWTALKEGTRKIATDVASEATSRAVAAAHDAAEPAAKSVAAAKVDEYMLAYEPTIRKQVVAMVGQVLTPELIEKIIAEVGSSRAAAPPSAEGDTEVPTVRKPEIAFPVDAVEEAATEELARQEENFSAFDAAADADADREQGEGERSRDDPQ